MGPVEKSNNLNFSNDGEIVVNNRKTRRTFPPDDPNKTKATWARQSRKELKRKRKLGRK